MVFFSLGLLSKAMLVTLPLVLLLLDYWPLGRFAVRPCRRATPPDGNEKNFAGRANFFETILGRFPWPWHLVLEKLPLLALVAVSGTMTIWSHTKALVPFEHIPLSWRIGNALVSTVAYLRQLFYPVGLAVLYPTADLDLPLGKIVVAVLVLTGVTAAALLGRRRYPYLLVGWLWYLGMLMPVMGLLQFGIFTMANRFTYLPQIGIYVALVWFAADACRAWPYRRSVCGVVSALVLMIVMGCAWRQTSFWRDSETLWTHTLACTSHNRLAHNDLGNVLADRGRLDEAVAQYRKSLEVDPNYTRAHFNLGTALFSQGRYDEAILHYRKALELEPDFALAHHNLAGVLTQQGRFGEAISQYRQALKTQPAFVESQKNLAWLRATCPQASLRNGHEAMTLAERANRLCGGQRPDVLDTLAAAYAEAGWFPEAQVTARKALELATQQNEHELADAIRARIARYDAGKPYREAPPVPAPSP